MSQTTPRVGIIIGSTREGRFSEKPAMWIHELAKKRTDLAVELIDLRNHALPFFNEPASPVWTPVKNEAAQRWAEKFATLDGLLAVTPGYTRGPSTTVAPARFSRTCSTTPTANSTANRLPSSATTPSTQRVPSSSCGWLPSSAKRPLSAMPLTLGWWSSWDCGSKASRSTTTRTLSKPRSPCLMTSLGGLRH